MITSQELIGLAAIAVLWMLGVTRIRSMLWGLAAQCAALSALPLRRGLEDHSPGDIWLGVTMLVVKAIAIPLFLNWSANRLQVTRDRGAGMPPALAMLLGAVIIFLCHFQSAQISADGAAPGSAGLALAIVVIGTMIMMTRRLALAMLIGFLVIDNGIFTYTFTQTRGLPITIELGIVFDLFVSVLLAGVVLFRVRKSFEHMDTFEMRELHE